MALPKKRLHGRHDAGAESRFLLLKQYSVQRYSRYNDGNLATQA